MTSDDFDETVASGVTLIDVWGPSCAPCLAMMPDVERFADERAADFKVVKLEAPKARRLCMRLKVMGLPAFLMYRDGEEIGRIGGNDVNMDVLRSWVDETLAGLAPQRG
ncbi:MAG TPA: thioredoxin family protein [Acidimicrobiales bacterium]|nr:thioredoxin family protein [Acidimicrobiales bacterium]